MFMTSVFSTIHLKTGYVHTTSGKWRVSRWVSHHRGLYKIFHVSPLLSTCGTREVGLLCLSDSNFFEELQSLKHSQCVVFVHMVCYKAFNFYFRRQSFRLWPTKAGHGQ